MWIVFAGIGVAIVVYGIERVSIELTSIGIVIGALALFHFFPLLGPDGQPLIGTSELLAGFANPALVSIMALLVLGQGLFQSGALEQPTRWLVERGEAAPVATLAGAFILVAIVSAFLNNTPVVVMFIPIIGAIAAKQRIATSRVMMPLSFFAVFGGMLTLIGSSTNLLAAQTMQAMGVGEIGFFDFTMIGGSLALVGAAYMFFVAPYLLPDRSSMAGEMGVSDGRQFIAQIDLTSGHPYCGISSVSGLFPDIPDVTVRMILRRETPILPPFEDVTLRSGDTMIVAATRKKLSEMLASNPPILEGTIDVAQFDEEDDAVDAKSELILAEAVVAPGSRIVGQSLARIGFHYQTGCIALGLQRRSRMIRIRMSDMRLEAGDVLLVFGSRKNIEGLRDNRDVLVLDWSATDVPKISHAGRAQLIFLGTIGAAAMGVLSIVLAALLGAGLMLASGCLNIRQAGRAFDRRIFLLVGAALAMGTSMQATGGAQFLAEMLTYLLGGASPSVVLSAFFLLVAIMTNILSNNATAVLFTPIAVNTAQQLGVDPMVFVIAVILAANTSFATPIAYQTNLLVMGPGHYKFRDFLMVGGPLSLLIWAAFSILAPWYYGLG
jgi:di/tricarboxylate transporter